MPGLENSEEIVIFRVQRADSQVLENGVNAVGFIGKIYYITQKANDKRVREKSFHIQKRKKEIKKTRKEKILTPWLNCIYSMEYNADMRNTRKSSYLSFQDKNNNISVRNK